MTTVAEVKKWTRPILAEHADLALLPRKLYLRPVKHVFQHIWFLGASDRTQPRPWSNYLLMFTPPSGPNSDNWGRELLVGWSTDPDFQETLSHHCRDALDKLRQVGSIEGLLSAMGEDGVTRVMSLDGLSHEPILYASILAALGRLPEAAVIAQNYIDKNEPRLLTQLENGEEMKTRRPRSLDARFMIDFATHFLKPMHELRQLVAATGANDRHAVAALLHHWERQNARRLEIEDIWEPTPFPLERDL